MWVLSVLVLITKYSVTITYYVHNICTLVVVAQITKFKWLHGNIHALGKQLYTMFVHNICIFTDHEMYGDCHAGLWLVCSTSFNNCTLVEFGRKLWRHFLINKYYVLLIHVYSTCSFWAYCVVILLVSVDFFGWGLKICTAPNEQCSSSCCPSICRFAAAGATAAAAACSCSL